jgi:hypothetical protein
MAHLAGTKLALDNWLDRNSQGVRNQLRYFANRSSLAAPDIDRQTIELAVFIKHWGQVVQESRAEDGDHACIRIEDGLAWAIGAGVAQRDRGNPCLSGVKGTGSVAGHTSGEPCTNRQCLCFLSHSKIAYSLVFVAKFMTRSNVITDVAALITWLSMISTWRSDSIFVRRYFSSHLTE